MNLCYPRRRPAAPAPPRESVAPLRGLSVCCWRRPPRAATVTYDFNDGTLQGWHNRVWDPALNAGAGAWTDLAPNTTDTYPVTLQPPSGDDNVFGNNGTQVDPVGGQTDNHLNTLWLRSPRFTLDASGDLTAQMARGRPTEPPPPTMDRCLMPQTARTGWKGVALRRVSDGAFVLAKPRMSEGDTMVTVTFTAAELAPYVGVICTLDLINSENAAGAGSAWTTFPFRAPYCPRPSLRRPLLPF